MCKSREARVAVTEVVELDDGAQNRPSAFAHRRSRRGWMEHLWSRADATEGNRAQINPPPKTAQSSQNPLLFIADSCGHNEIVRGRRFESVRGLCKSRKPGVLCSGRLARRRLCSGK